MTATKQMRHEAMRIGGEKVFTDDVVEVCLSPLELCQYILAKGVRKHGSKALF